MLYSLHIGFICLFSVSSLLLSNINIDMSEVPLGTPNEIRLCISCFSVKITTCQKKKKNRLQRLVKAKLLNHCLFG